MRKRGKRTRRRKVKFRREKKKDRKKFWRNTANNKLCIFCTHMHLMIYDNMNCNTLTRMRVISRFYFVHSMYRYVCVLHYICTTHMWQGFSVFTFVCDMLINRCDCVYLRLFGYNYGYGCDCSFTYFECMRTHAPVGKRTHMRIFSFGMNRFPSSIIHMRVHLGHVPLLIW